MRDRAGCRNDKTADGTKYRGKGDSGDDGKECYSKALSQQRRRHIIVCQIYYAVDHRSKPHKQREHIEQADSRNGDNSTLTGSRWRRHGVVADKNVRQRRRTKEKRQHQ